MSLWTSKRRNNQGGIQLPSEFGLDPFGASITPKVSASEKKLKFIVGLSPQALKPLPKPPTFKTETLKTLETEGPIESIGSMSPSFRGRPIRLARPSQDQGFRSADFTNKRLTSLMGDEEEAINYKRKLATPVGLENPFVDDLSPQAVLGAGCGGKFYSHYKKLDKVKDINSYMQVKDSVYTSILGKSESLHLLPSKMGFIREKGDADRIRLSHFRLGDKYAEVLSEGLKSIKGVNKIELSNNRITAAGAEQLLTKLDIQTEKLDLSGNSIGKIGSQHLCSLISHKSTMLLDLNLEGNKLGDIAVGQICEVVAYNNTLRKLNLGKNFLSDNVAEKLSKMVELNSTLEELYLRWNQIKGPGGSTIMEGLKGATQLRVLDFSWNSLGQNGAQFAKSFGSYIATNTTLVHLDLSNNYIAKPEAQVIAEDLKANHTLYGFHFHGNVGYVDFKGFLVIPDDCEQSVNGRLIQPSITSIDYNSESLKHHIGNWGEYKDVCWICEGWRPVEFTWKPEESGPGEQDPIYLHLSFEGYKGVFLPSKDAFRNVRMVPPLRFEYFYTVDEQAVHAANQLKGKPQSPILKIKVGEEERQVDLTNVNCCEKAGSGKVLDDEYEVVERLVEYNIKPRIPDELYIPPDVLVIRPPWKLAVSIFRNYRADTQALLDECFKTDFENNRITKIVKNPEDAQQVRDIFYESYRAIKDCYKYYAAIGAPSEIWSIPLNTYTDLCSTAKIIDKEIVKLSDFDRIFIGTYTKTDNKDRNPRNPDRALVRHQFMEGLVRLAEHKYIGSGAVQTYAQAVKMIMDDSMTPFLAGFNHQKWRGERYWNEQVDIVYKSYLPVVRGVYRKYYGMKTLPGQKKFMCLEEFNRFVGDANMFNDNCAKADAILAFSISMMTQVDELNSDRIFQMQFVEFLEALGRIADKFSPYPYGFVTINPETGQPEADMSYEERFAQPLHVKLEGLMPNLFSLCGNDVKELWALPETSIFKMQEVNAKQRFATKKKKILRINPTHMNSIEPYDGINALQI